MLLSSTVGFWAGSSKGIEEKKWKKKKVRRKEEGRISQGDGTCQMLDDNP